MKSITPKCEVILGPPGTGKTTSLISVARDHCTDEEHREVLFVSHTKIAAGELKGRCGMDKAEARTMHSVCYDVLDLSRAQVIDDAKLASFGRIAQIDFTAEAWAVEALAVLSKSDCTGESLEKAFIASQRPCTWRDFNWLAQSYRNWKDANGFIDFSDMLSIVVRAKPTMKWRKIFVDEAQDLSPMQWAVVDHLAQTADLVVVAGDDDQALFTWGGADEHGIERFTNQYNAKTRVLAQSYRVPRSIHAFATKITERISRRLEKQYAPRDADGSVSHITTFESLRLEELDGSVVLYRDKSALETIEPHLQALKMRYVSTVPAHTTPYESRQAKALRILDKMRRGETISEREHKLVRSALTDYALRLFDDRGAAPVLKLSPYAALTGPHWLLDYLDSVDVTLPVQVKIGTVHSFKGAENKRVILHTGMSPRIARGFAENPDPEHRVWYVGVTRALDDLIITSGYNEYTI